MARGSGINRRELDKWAKGLVKEANKSLERAARRNPSRLPVQFETSAAGGGALNGGEAIERLAFQLEQRGLVDIARSFGGTPRRPPH